MLWLGKKNVTGDEPIDANEILRLIRKVTMDDIMRLSSNTFKKDNINIALIGPKEHREKETIHEIVQGL